MHPQKTLQNSQRLAPEFFLRGFGRTPLHEAFWDAIFWGWVDYTNLNPGANLDGENWVGFFWGEMYGE